MNRGAKARTVTRGIRLLVVAALLTLLSHLLAVSQPVRAAPYIVTNSNDSGPGSLRQAITDANNNPGPDTITFDTATDGTAIVLSGAADEDANASGDLDVLDGGDLTIQGNGVANTLIDGGGIDRVLHVCPGGGCTNTVTLTGVTIRNGSAVVAGGGIYNRAGTTTLEGSAVSANTADFGGGVYNLDTLNVQNGSTIGGAGVGNTATTNGGGIFNSAGAVTVNGSTVSANGAIKGGGIFNWEEGALNVANSTIGGADAGNLATGEGGGIYNEYSGTATVAGSSVSANWADHGGGIYNKGTMTVDSSVVSANTADRGGGIYNRATLNVQTGSTIGGAGAGNTVTGSGGGIYNEQGGTTTVDSSTVSANTAYDGGGIHTTGTLHIQNGSTVGGTGAGNAADYSGGGITNWGNGTTTVDGSVVSANTATIGGGVYNTSGTVYIQNDSTVSANMAAAVGGGIDNWGGTLTVGASTISANAATNGGGINNGAGGTLSVQNGSTIGGAGVGNTATGSGGGIHNELATATVTGSRIQHNTAGDNGGGVYNSWDVAGATSVTGSCIVGNSATSFFNIKAAEQIATGNWWGATTGPNTFGADTFGGNVDTSGYSTAPILGCAPDLQVTKANDTGGGGRSGTPFAWILTISNTGVTDAVFGTGQTILRDDLPVGPIYGALVVVNFVNVTNPANIDCGMASHILTCNAGGGGVLIGLSGSFDVVLSVTPNSAGTLSNPAGICRVDPDGNVGESDEGNNNCPTDTVNVAAWMVYVPLALRQSP